MPINRPDGRHWCAPDQETPDAEGTWTCPECKTLWLFSHDDQGSGLWETPEGRETRQNAMQAPPPVIVEDEVDDGER